MYKNKKFDYDLWTTNDNGIKRYWVRIRATQEVVEVDLETLRFLRTEEKKLNRYRENMLKNNITLRSYDAFIINRCQILKLSYQQQNRNLIKQRKNTMP